jgi:hypothetical protein
MLNIFLLNDVIPNISSPPSYHHYCLDGSYRTLASNVNHYFVIARGQKDDYCSGQDKDETELALVGERLDFKLLQALDNQVEAEAAAQSLRVEARLNTVEGYIVAGTNCGIELWDVVRIYDNSAGQDGKDFRVSGISLIWHSATLQYCHKLFLCAM